MNKEDHIEYWKAEAEDSWESALVLMNNRKYLMAAFCFHLCIEKLLKGCWVKTNTENYPPRTHNLIYLHDESKLNLPEKMQKDFIIINTWNLEGRYPEYKERLIKTIDKSYLDSKFETLQKIKLCLQEKLQ